MGRRQYSHKRRRGGRYTPPSTRFMRVVLCDGCALCKLLEGSDAEVVTIHEIAVVSDDDSESETAPPWQAELLLDQYPWANQEQIYGANPNN